MTKITRIGYALGAIVLGGFLWVPIVFMALFELSYLEALIWSIPCGIFNAIAPHDDNLFKRLNRNPFPVIGAIVIGIPVVLQN